MKEVKRLPVEKLVVLSYNGHLFPAHTPEQIRAAKPRKDEYAPTPARYAPPRVSVGYTFGEGKGGVPNLRDRREETFESGEALEAVSCQFPIHDAPNFARWIDDDDRAKISAAREAVEREKRKLAAAIKRAYERGRPITPAEVRDLK